MLVPPSMLQLQSLQIFNEMSMFAKLELQPFTRTVALSVAMVVFGSEVVTELLPW